MNDEMTLGLVFDPLFRLPLLTGLLLAIALPLLGAGLRLREQWLSGLGVAQVAAAGGVAATLLHAPVLLFALLAAGLAGLVRALLGQVRNEHYAVMLLVGWAAVLLLAMFGHHAESVAQTVLNGQLYFTGPAHAVAAGVLLLALALLGRWLSPQLLKARLFPHHFRANLRRAWPHELVFEALIVAVVALGIVTMGVMATFAMLFVPPWVSFRLARGWPAALTLCSLTGVVSYLIGFTVAISWDLPFGPTVVAALLATVPLRLLPGRLGRAPAGVTDHAAVRQTP